MKLKLKEIVFACLFTLALPAVIVSVFGRKPDPAKETLPVFQEATQPQEVLTVSVLSREGSVLQMPLEEYLVCVLLREMPAEFELEALKAQAVVARTYTLRREALGSKHEDATVCMNASCCQGYYDPQAYLQDGGVEADIERMRLAVLQTQGLVLVYEGVLAEATYFSCSGGLTEDASAVWGADIPYLRSTLSPGEEQASHYIDSVSFTADAFAKALGFQPTGYSAQWIGDIQYTRGGGVATIDLCGRTYTGTQVRQLLGLRSTAFAITAVGDTVTVTTKGFGHRVGMSQYGADAMAVSGSSFQQILSHYYQGTQLIPYSTFAD